MFIYLIGSMCSNRFVHSDPEIRMSYVRSKRGEIIQLIYWSLAILQHGIVESVNKKEFY